jgi:small subunit ribosomal protein S4
VFRLGFANSRRAARQMVRHGHIAVNGEKASIPSIEVKIGHFVSVRETPRARQMATKALELMSMAPVPEWLLLEKDAFKAEVKRIPSREEIAPIANEQAVVELYSR